MVKLDRYIGTSVLVAILSVLAIILGLVLLFAFIEEIKDVDSDYTLAKAAWYVLLTSPRRIYDNLPMAALIGSLIGLGTLASSSELTVMRAAGVSTGRIVLAVMKPLVLLMLVNVAIGEYATPWSESQAQAFRAIAQLGDRDHSQSGRHGVWHRQGNEYIHINAVQPRGELIGVTRYIFDDQRRMQSASFADRAKFEKDHWLLKNVTTTNFVTGATEVVDSQQDRWDVALTPQLLSVVVLEPDSLSGQGLWGYIHYLSDQGLNNSVYWLAFWGKVLQPLVTAALVLMAISFIFGPLRSVTLGQRLFTGVVVGAVFSVLQKLLGPASQIIGFSPLFAVLVPVAICGIWGFILLRRAR